jgi:hypothetical protein
MLPPTIEGEFIEFSLRRHKTGTKEDMKGFVNSFIADLHRLIEEAYGENEDTC